MLVDGSDTFPASVRVIDDGDPCGNAEHGATATDLADRTKYTFNRLSHLSASYSFVASSVANDTLCTLTEVHNVSGFVLSSNRARVPETGLWEIRADAVATSSNASGFAVDVAGGVDNLSHIAGAPASGGVAVAVGLIVNITNTATQTIAVQAKVNGGSTVSIGTGGAAASRLTIKKVGPSP